MKNNLHGRLIEKILKYTFLLVLTIVILYPILFVAISSLKTDKEIFINPFGLAENPMFQNYKVVWLDMELWKYMLNSLYYSFCSVVLTLFCAVGAAYAFARMKWKLSRVTMGFLMLGLMIPMHAIILPLYLSVRKMGIHNPRFILVLIFSAFALPKSTFILTNFLGGIPKSIEEAAVLDGAGIFRIIISIVLPLMTPAIAVVVVFDFLAVWNDLLISLIFINDKADRTLQMGIMMFKGDYVTNYNYVMTAVTCAIIPTILVYVFFQKKIVAGLSAGAVKE